jgi:hypothetical protein
LQESQIVKEGIALEEREMDFSALRMELFSVDSSKADLLSGPV